ncbi:hypothetical protein CHARACLAT_019122 [Characodon lateralis]|uniref:Uncharacterized protein n=1 Tax=Characodon lateralis TaxID=208331 RepID=A0ABU7ECC3_9TELE|nr:hypothetical protein [Characodon lateralis]
MRPVALTSLMKPEIKEIRKGMQQDAHPGQGGLISQLTSGPWWQLLLKIMIPFLILVLFLPFHNVYHSLYQSNDSQDGCKHSLNSAAPGLPAVGERGSRS